MDGYWFGWVESLWKQRAMFGFSIIDRFKAVFLFWFLCDTCCYVRVYMVSSIMLTCITAAKYSFWVICLVIMFPPPKVRGGHIGFSADPVGVGVGVAVANPCTHNIS